MDPFTAFFLGFIAGCIFYAFLSRPKQSRPKQPKQGRYNARRPARRWR